MVGAEAARAEQAPIILNMKASRPRHAIEDTGFRTASVLSAGTRPSSTGLVPPSMFCSPLLGAPYAP